MSTEAYTDRDGRSYENHGIEPTLRGFTEGDEIYVKTANEAYSGVYTFVAFTIDPDLHVTLENQNGDLCGFRRCISDRDTLAFIPHDTMIAETTVEDVHSEIPTPGPTLPDSPEEAPAEPATPDAPTRVEDTDPTERDTSTEEESVSFTVDSDTTGQVQFGDYSEDVVPDTEAETSATYLGAEKEETDSEPESTSQASMEAYLPAT